MKLDIPYYIRQVLREQRMVHIPGIGTLRLNQNSAKFNDDKTILSPPSLDVFFDDSESDDDSLLKYILDAGLLTEAKARKKIEQYTQSAFNNLLNVDSFMIDGVGAIVKKAGQEKVQFESNVTDLTREFADLSTLNLTPIARFAELQPQAAVADGKRKVEESGSFISRILLIALALVLLYFLGRYFYDTYFNQPDEEKTEIIDSANTEEEASIDEASNKELEQKYEEIDELIDPEKSQDEVKTGDSKLEEELSNLTEQSESEENETANDIAKVDEVKTKDEPADTEVNKSVREEEASSKPKNKHADIIPESGECIIVVGSFIKSLNAIKMTSLLERKGYKVYQSEYKGYKRVGLKYECVDEDLEEFLQDIRKKISKRAWYLDPSLDVPYKKK